MNPRRSQVDVNKSKKNRLFTVPYFPIRPSRSSAVCYGPPSCFRRPPAWYISENQDGGLWQKALDLDGLTEKLGTVNSLATRNRTTRIFSQEYRTSRREIKDLLCGQKENFSCGATLGISSGEDRPRTIRDNTDTLFNPKLPIWNCSFSSLEPLGLICLRPRDQETTGSGDENGNCHVKQLAYFKHFSLKQTVRCLITLPK